MILDDKYFWAWRRCTGSSKEDTPAPENHDVALLEGILTMIIRDKKVKGDGKFNRVSNYLNDICDSLTWIKGMWSGDDELLNAFMLGLDAACQAIKKEVSLIDDKDDFEWEVRDWRE